MAKRRNFSEYEKQVLLELVNGRKDIIEDKRNDGRMISKKESAWEDLRKDFNARHGVHEREVGSLKNLWKNLKNKTKKAVADDRYFHLVYFSTEQPI